MPLIPADPDAQQTLWQFIAGGVGAVVTTYYAARKFWKPGAPEIDTDRAAELAKENARLLAEAAEQAMRSDFQQEIADLKNDFYDALKSIKEYADMQHDAVSKALHAIELSIARMEALINGQRHR